MNNINIQDIKNSLLGTKIFRNFLDIQAGYSFAVRGGSTVRNNNPRHEKRLVNDVNLLGREELRSLVFNEQTFSN